VAESIEQSEEREHARQMNRERTSDVNIKAFEEREHARQMNRENTSDVDVKRIEGNEAVIREKIRLSDEKIKELEEQEMAKDHVEEAAGSDKTQDIKEYEDSVSRKEQKNAPATMGD
jgi:hypothetical protein